MDRKTLHKVVAAYLHDPPEKPYHIMASGKQEGHEEYTRIYYLDPLGISAEGVKSQDREASHFDRLPFFFAEEKETGYAWAKDADMYFIHPMAKEYLRLYTKAQIKSIYDHFLTQGGFSKDILKNIKEVDENTPILLYWELSLPRIYSIKNISTKITSTLIPADTRMPYHTIVDHLEMAAALSAVGGIDNASLLVFNIRGVQDFIKGAIKTKDLWAGSMLVALLMVEAIGAIVKEYGPQNVVYPSLHMNALFKDWVKDNMEKPLTSSVLGTDEWFDSLIPSIPNKLVAIVERGKEEEIVKKMIDAIHKRWMGMVEKAYEHMEDNEYEIIKSIEEWKKQASQFPSIAYAYVPLSNEEIRKWLVEESALGYKTLMDKLEELARKNVVKVYKDTKDLPLYTFASEAVDAKLNVSKNYQPPAPYDGIEATFQKPPYIEKSDSGSGLEAVARRISGRERNDRLDVISAVKRFLAEEEFRFEVPSVSEIAALELASGKYGGDFKNDKLKNLVDRISEKAKEYNYPTFKEYLKERGYSPTNHSYITYLGLTQALWYPEEYGLTAGDIKEAVGKKPADIPNRVAILVMDGDKMGAWVGMKFDEIERDVSGIENIKPHLTDFMHPDFVKFKEGDIDFGRKIKDIENALGDLAIRIIGGPYWHKTISSALSWFSILVKFIVRKHEGFLVYAGGDDVLAILPPSRAIKAAVDIQSLYRGMYQEHIKVGGNTLCIEDGFIYVRETRTLAGKTEEIKTPIGILPGPNMTMSTGVYISHFKHPLRLMLDGARRAEKKAKGSRNSIAVIAMQRSGKEIEMVSSYEKVLKIEKIYDEYIEGNMVSPRFIYDFAHRYEEGCIVWNDIAVDTVMQKAQQINDTESAKKFVAYILDRRKKVDGINLSSLVEEIFDDSIENFALSIDILRMIRYLRQKGGEDDETR